MDNVLEVRDMNKTLNNFQLTDINFYFEQGYIMGLIGPSGAGKTTLINMLLGLYKLDSGTVKVCGHDLVNEGRTAKDCMGFVLDSNPFQEELSASQNAKLFGRFYSKWNEEKFNSYMDMFEVNKKKPLKKLSKGTIIRFQLAFAMSHGAKLLIMDEPVSGLDPVFRRELMELFTDIIMKGETSILFSTHITEELDKVADYITFMDEGKIKLSLPKEELLDKYQIIKGSQNQINAIPKEIVIGKKITDYTGEALILNNNAMPNISVNRQIPTLEDILYYTVKNK